MKNRKEKEEKIVGIKYLNTKGSTVLGLNQCIGIYRHSSNFYYHWSWWLSG